MAEPLDSFYRRYNDVCNGHDFSRLPEFVAEDVVVDGEPRGLEGYVAALEAVVAAFPDHRWDLQHLLVDGSWVAAHLLDTGTHRGTFLGVAASGRSIEVQEFAVYRVEDGLIREVWGTADTLALREQME